MRTARPWIENRHPGDVRCGGARARAPAGNSPSVMLLCTARATSAPAATSAPPRPRPLHAKRGRRTPPDRKCQRRCCDSPSRRSRGVRIEAEAQRDDRREDWLSEQPANADERGERHRTEVDHMEHVRGGQWRQEAPREHTRQNPGQTSELVGAGSEIRIPVVVEEADIVPRIAKSLGRDQPVAVEGEQHEGREDRDEGRRTRSRSGQCHALCWSVGRGACWSRRRHQETPEQVSRRTVRTHGRRGHPEGRG